MGHNLCLHFGVDEHPFAIYFDVHHSHMEPRPGDTPTGDQRTIPPSLNQGHHMSLTKSCAGHCFTMEEHGLGAGSLFGVLRFRLRMFVVRDSITCTWLSWNDRTGIKLHNQLLRLPCVGMFGAESVPFTFYRFHSLPNRHIWNLQRQTCLDGSDQNPWKLQGP